MKIFISYKWENEMRNLWVEKMYRDLRLLGFEAIIDRYEVAPGDSFSDYMTKHISTADYVLFIITPASKAAVESGKGALAFEMQISNARKLTGKDGFKIIPILREGSESPNYLSDHRYLDFRDDADYNKAMGDLIKWLNGEIKPPKIGFNDTKAADILRVLPITGKVEIEGWSRHEPKSGEKGVILLASHDLLEYTTSINLESTQWWKGFYVWTLVWDDKIGIVVSSRTAISEN